MAPTRPPQNSNPQKNASQPGAKRVNKQEAQNKVKANKEALEHALQQDENAEEVKRYEELLNEAQADVDAMEVEEANSDAQGGVKDAGTTETTNQNGDGTSAGVKSEPDEESLFTNGGKDGLKGSESPHGSRKNGSRNEQDGEDETGLVTHMDCMDISAGEMVKFYSVAGRYYAIDEYGTGNRKKFAIRKLPAKPEGEAYKGMNLDASVETVEKEKIYQILGVAWQTKNNLSRMKTMSFENWTLEKSGIRRRAPNMRVHIRWNGPDGPDSWEKRAGVKGKWLPDSKYRGVIGNDRFEAPENIEYDGIQMLKSGVEIFKADYAIIDSAIRYEKRYDELNEAKKQGKKFETHDRDPTPGAPLRSEEQAGNN